MVRARGQHEVGPAGTQACLLLGLISDHSSRAELHRRRDRKVCIWHLGVKCRSSPDHPVTCAFVWLQGGKDSHLPGLRQGTGLKGCSVCAWGS